MQVTIWMKERWMVQKEQAHERGVGHAAMSITYTCRVVLLVITDAQTWALVYCVNRPQRACRRPSYTDKLVQVCESRVKMTMRS